MSESPELSKSPRIERFRSETAIDPAAALESLRTDLRAAQGPLIEAGDETGQVRVTFVHIADTDSVTLSCQLFPVQMPAKVVTEMHRIAGTDVWYVSTLADPRVTVPYQFRLNSPSLGNTMAEALTLMSDETRFAEHMRATFDSGRADPFNPRRFYPLAGLIGGDLAGAAPEHKWESVLVLPAAEPFPSFDGKSLRGRLESHTFDATALPGERTVSVYTPPEYDDSKVLPVLIVLDGEMALRSGQLDQQLDAMIAAGSIPPVIGVFWGNRTVNSRMSEMACNPALSEAIADELLPWVRANYAISPRRTEVTIAGMSYGGLAAAWLALDRPDAFGGAVLMSPSLWFAPPAAQGAEPEKPEWLTRRYAERPAADVRLFVSVGQLENATLPSADDEPLTMVRAARHFRDVVREKGYDLAGYREEPAGHDFVNVRRVIARALPALLHG